METTVTVRISIKRLDASIALPSSAHLGDAGLDLQSSTDLTLAPGERAVVPTGIALAIPDGYAGFVQPRSGLAARHGIGVVNSPGLIDAGYRGEVKVVVINLDRDEPFEIKAGDRIAQLVILQVPAVEIVECDELPSSARGASGFGSSGVKTVSSKG